MSGIDLPPVEVLRERAAARVDALRPVVAAGDALLVALEVSGGAGFALAAGDACAIKGRSLLAAILPKVLSWRARLAAGLGPEHEPLISGARAALVVPADRRDAAITALWRDAQAIREGTADALVLDVAWCELGVGALEGEAGAANSGFVQTLDAVLDQGIDAARRRRADGAPGTFWEPVDPVVPGEGGEGDALGALGRRVGTSAGRAGVIGVGAAAAGDGAAVWPALGIAIATGASVDEVTGALEGPRLLLRIDGLPPEEAGEGDEVAELPLAGVWMRAEGDAPLDLGALEARASGAPALGVMRLDLDTLGRALHDVATGKAPIEGLRDRLALAEAVAVACGPIADAVIEGPQPASTEGPANAGPAPRALQWLVAGGGELCLAGAWSDVIEVAGSLREAIVPGLQGIVDALGAAKAARSLDLSAGLVIARAGVTPAFLAARAGEALRRAKGERRGRAGERRWKKAIAWDGIPVGWHDWALVVALGGELGRAIEAGEVPRSLLPRLAAIHALWRRGEDALEAGEGREAAAAAKRRWRWAHALAGDKGAPGGEVPGARLIARLSRLALEDADDAAEGGDRRTEQEAAAWLGMVAWIARRRISGMGGEERT